jgi:hypothetical protein
VNIPRPVVGGALLLGFILGALNPGEESRTFMGLLWAGGTVLGGIVASLVFSGISKLGLFGGWWKKASADARFRMMGVAFFLGAVATWVLLYFNLG